MTALKMHWHFSQGGDGNKHLTMHWELARMRNFVI
jgi:hypothetical protein